ncbi:CDK2-associated and cullin domain-containing protein 1 isoform X5 [Rhinolophus sinicus]|uniref:CDK2-associated and cullin domain-containing protein 1 isoform X5 n=1 Tax=Rhinolophus sinicus TaxID=89399 RepID=UPI003D7B74FE
MFRPAATARLTPVFSQHRDLQLQIVMNVITIEDYKSTYWPKLDGAIDQLLTQSPGDYIPISYEQIYSCVYKCVCQQHSEQMYSDLIKKITNHLERVSKELQASPPDVYIERFNVALGQYMGALQSIVPLFIYMNKFYIETKLNRDLKDDLIKLFTEHVAEKHIYSLMPLLLEAQSTPFQVTPSTMANIVKGLYTLRPEWVQMAPSLFSKFIPNILPPAVESELSEYAAQDQKLQRELIQNGFMRGDQSRKRAGDELAYSQCVIKVGLSCSGCCHVQMLLLVLRQLCGGCQLLQSLLERDDDPVSVADDLAPFYFTQSHMAWR